MKSCWIIYFVLLYYVYFFLWSLGIFYHNRFSDVVTFLEKTYMTKMYCCLDSDDFTTLRSYFGFWDLDLWWYLPTYCFSALFLHWLFFPSYYTKIQDRKNLYTVQYTVQVDLSHWQSKPTLLELIWLFHAMENLSVCFVSQTPLSSTLHFMV